MSRGGGEDQASAPDCVPIRPGGNGVVRRWREGGIRRYLIWRRDRRIGLSDLVGNDEDQQRNRDGEDDALGIAVVAWSGGQRFGHLPPPKRLSGSLRNAVPQASASGRRPPRMFT